MINTAGYYFISRLKSDGQRFYEALSAMINMNVMRCSPIDNTYEAMEYTQDNRMYVTAWLANNGIEW